MANTKSAAKRARQTKTRSLRNRTVISALKTQSRKFSAPAAGKEQRAAFESMVSELDRAVKRGVIHRNAANRRKSRLASQMAKKS